mmetsp:Transcript_12075/g.23083  ORF Transcript_12075/g.23083 Transcript_12075/m.23083 type:complete len:277 (-) Transcript_12075:162-992(-)
MYVYRKRERDNQTCSAKDTDNHLGRLLVELIGKICDGRLIIRQGVKMPTGPVKATITTSRRSSSCRRENGNLLLLLLFFRFGGGCLFSGTTSTTQHVELVLVFIFFPMITNLFEIGRETKGGSHGIIGLFPTSGNDACHFGKANLALFRLGVLLLFAIGGSHDSARNDRKTFEQTHAFALKEQVVCRQRALGLGQFLFFCFCFFLIREGGGGSRRNLLILGIVTEPRSQRGRCEEVDFFLMMIRVILVAHGLSSRTVQELGSILHRESLGFDLQQT